jgi:hypothetical protein
VLQPVKVLAATGCIARQQQLGGQAEQAFRGLNQQRRVEGRQRHRRVRLRGAHEVRHDPVLQERQRLVGLLRRKIMVSGAPNVP